MQPSSSLCLRQQKGPAFSQVDRQPSPDHSSISILASTSHFRSVTLYFLLVAFFKNLYLQYYPSLRRLMKFKCVHRVIEIPLHELATVHIPRLLCSSLIDLTVGYTYMYLHMSWKRHLFTLCHFAFNASNHRTSGTCKYACGEKGAGAIPRHVEKAT